MAEESDERADGRTVLVISAGGTRLEAAIASRLEDVRASDERAAVATASPTASLGALLGAIEQRRRGRELRAIGVASFGPLLREEGRIASTPKPGWTDFSWRDYLTERFGAIPVVVETDVNAAAVAEYRHGAAAGASLGLYVTVGTGIGGGVVANGALLAATRHPEMGHLRIPRVEGDVFAGSCPFHGDCLEGLASGVAIGARAGRAAHELDDADPAWPLEAQYLALGLADLELAIAPDRIVLGGGILERAGLLDATRRRLDALLAGYRDDPRDGAAPSTRVVAPVLGRDPELVGAYELARDALDLVART